MQQAKLLDGFMNMKEGNLHREITKGLNLDRILCIKTERVVRNDFTIAHNSKLYQILDKGRAKKVSNHPWRRVKFGMQDNNELEPLSTSMSLSLYYLMTGKDPRAHYDQGQKLRSHE